MRAKIAMKENLKSCVVAKICLAGLKKWLSIIALGVLSANANIIVDDCDKDTCASKAHNYEIQGDVDRAIAYYKKAIELGDVEAYSFLALLYQAQNNPALARQNFQLGCDKGQYDACYNFGIFLELGRDFANAKTHYAMACEKGNDKVKSNACHNLGVLYSSKDLGGQEEYEKALQYYKEACDLGNPKSCGSLGTFYEKGNGGVEQDYAKAFGLYESACNQGEARSCFNLGTMYDRGYSVKQNFKKAFGLYQIACNAKHAEACNNMGLMYDEGLGVRKSAQKALEYYNIACDLQSLVACNNLGYLYENEPKLKDVQKAYIYYQKACDMKSSKACYNLGYLYDNDEENRNATKAFELYQIACDYKDAMACNNLGNLYDKGDGVEQNFEVAKKFYERACEMGAQLGCVNKEMWDKNHTQLDRRGNNKK